MEQKYFTPDIADIRVWYECEWKRYSSDDWNKTTITEDDYVMYGQDPKCEISEIASSFKKGNVRTPYLTREQIESEGWVKSHPRLLKIIIDRTGRVYYYKPFDEEVSTFWVFEQRGGNVKISILGKETGYGFYGSCPSINELRLIQKLLNIK